MTDIRGGYLFCSHNKFFRRGLSFHVVAISLVGFIYVVSFGAAYAAVPKILGFRDANFGMSQDEVRAVISRDFHLPSSAIHASENPIQRTPVLTVRVPNVLSDGGTAEINYIFGYRSGKLIEINILWSKKTDPAITSKQIGRDGATLQAYFEQEGFPKSHSGANIPVPGGVVLFRAADDQHHAIVLLLMGNISKRGKSRKSVLKPTGLRLVYAENPAHPDVYKLKPGSF